MEVRRYSLINEGRRSQLGPLLRVVTMIVSNHHATGAGILDVLYDICAQSLW